MEILKKIMMPWGIAGLVLTILAGMWNHFHHSLSDAQAAVEAANLKLKGQIVSDEASATDLRGQISSLLSQNADLQKLYDDARKAAPGAVPVEAGSYSTGSVVAKGVPRSTGTPLPGAGATAPLVSDPPPVAGGHSGEATQEATQGNEAPASPACLLAPGDRGEIRVDEIEMKTQAGNTVVVGTAQAWRTYPGPATAILTGGFNSHISLVETLKAPSEPRWGVSVLGGCGRAGCGPGLGLALPPVTFLGTRLEAAAGLLGGPNLLIIGSLTLRR